MGLPLIAGVTRQGGAYQSQILLQKGFATYFIVRRSSFSKGGDMWLRRLGIEKGLRPIDDDLSDEPSVVRAGEVGKPDEIYNLGAQSFVMTSWRRPIITGRSTAPGAGRSLEALRLACRTSRFYQASSSEMYGLTREPVQTERTPFYPRNPCAVAKVYAHWLAVNCRESFSLHASSGILFSQESPLRGLEFVTRMITNGVAGIKLGLETRPPIGNLSAQRGWGHARDYVRAMWSMLWQDEADDFVIATGRTTSVCDFCKLAFEAVGLNLRESRCGRSEFSASI